MSLEGLIRKYICPMSGASVRVGCNRGRQEEEMDPRVEVIVVYNEPDTLERNGLGSEGLGGGRVRLIDNTAAGRSLPAIFNEYKARAAADWLVFCHQDLVVFDDDWIERITRLPQDSCYGPLGVDRAGRVVGSVTQADGKCLGQPADGVDVVAVDEQCLIVPRPIYSTLDFDERFACDLYAYDYSLTATHAGFRVKTFKMNCQRRSKSVTGDTTRRSYLEPKRTYIWKHRHSAPLITTTFRWTPRYWSVPDESETLRTELADSTRQPGARGGSWGGTCYSGAQAARLRGDGGRARPRAGEPGSVPLSTHGRREHRGRGPGGGR